MYARIGVHFFEYYIFWIFTIVQTLFANWHIVPLIIGLVLLLSMLIMMLATPRRTRSEDFEYLNRINSFKKVVVLLRILLVGMFLCFLYFIEKIGLDEVRVFTIICYFLLTMDIVLNLVILFTRLRGLCQPGMRHPYARMNDDYRELLDGGDTKLNDSWLQPSVGNDMFDAGPDNLKAQKQNENELSNIISEVHSIPEGTPIFEAPQGKQSTFTKDNDGKFNEWQ